MMPGCGSASVGAKALIYFQRGQGKCAITIVSFSAVVSVKAEK